jgi:carboxymethylenebutenolidase
LLPDVYYRHGDWKPFDMHTAFSNQEERTRLMGMVGSVTPDLISSDAGAFFDFLESRPEAKGSRFGVFGYCMGGRMSVIVAGRQPDRVAAAASFHGGGLVTDDPNSPHLLADRMTATVYVAGAENDQSFSTDNAETLDKALTAAGVEHMVEFYPAGHGFAVPDNPPYDEAAADRHWAALERLFGASLA